MIIECRKGKKAFSRLIFQPLQKAKKCFLLLYHCNRNRQISFRNLLANQRFAVEILEFRLSIVVIMIIECRKGEQAFSRLINQPSKKTKMIFCNYIIATEIDKFPFEIC